MVCKLDDSVLLKSYFIIHARGSHYVQKTCFHPKHKKLFHFATSLEALQTMSHLQVQLPPHSVKPPCGGAIHNLWKIDRRDHKEREIVTK